MKIESTRYDILLTVMCWLLAAGQIGAFWQPVRVLILILLPFFVIDSIKGRKPFFPAVRETPSYRYELILFVIWGLYAALSVYWAIDLESSSKAFIHLIIVFFGFGEMLWLAGKAKHPQKSIMLGWLLMFLTTLPIALNELINDQHLSMSVQESDMTMRMGSHTFEERHFASVTFGNLNSYNVVLCFSFCIMMIQTLRNDLKERLCALAALVIIVAIIAVNSSRAALICLIFGVLMYVIVLIKKRTHVVLLLSGLALALGAFLYRFADLFSMIIMRFQSQGLEDKGRSSVLVHGIEELYNSYGFGVGINNFSPIMESKYALDISAPHNLLLEVGAQFGVLILIGFIGMFVRIYRQSKQGNNFNRSAAILGLMPLLPISIIDSTYLLKAPTWLYIATLYIFTNIKYNDTEK